MNNNCLITSTTFSDTPPSHSLNNNSLNSSSSSNEDEDVAEINNEIPPSKPPSWVNDKIKFTILCHLIYTHKDNPKAKYRKASEELESEWGLKMTRIEIKKGGVSDLCF